MSAGALADVVDVEAVWRPLDADERAQTETLLRLASSLVRQLVPGIDARLEAAADDTFGDVVRGVVANVVVRVLVNPDGVTQQTEGPFSVTRLATAERLYLSTAELALLRPRPVVVAGVYSVPLA